RDLQHFFGRHVESGFAHDRQQALAQVFNRQPANVLGVQPERFGIEGIFGRGQQIPRFARNDNLVGSWQLLEVHHRIRAVDALERDGVNEFLAAHLGAVVFRRPAQQAEEIDERLGQESGVAVRGDAGFLPEAFVNFLCLLGWSPKDDRTQMSRQELIDAISLEGINRANAVVNFKELPTPNQVVIPSEARNLLSSPEDTFDPKALWLNAEHIRGLTIEDLSQRLLPIVREAGFN